MIVIRSIKKILADRFGLGKGCSKLKVEASMDAYQGVFHENQQGQLILLDLMRFADMDKVCFTNDLTPSALAFTEGKRAVIHYILMMSELSEIEMLAKKEEK